MFFRAVLVSSIALSLADCAADVGDGKAKAVVEDAPVAPVTAPVAAAGDGLPVPALTASKVIAVDATQSQLGAIGAKVTAQYPITFGKFAGSVGLDGETVTGIAFAARIDSLHVEPAKLQGHLQTPDFLDATAFPFATFQSSEVKAGSDQPGFTHTITGDLTIHGKAKRVTFPATVTVEAGKVQAKTEFTIDRRDFGVVYPGMPDDLVQDNVLLQVAFVAPRG